MMSCCLWHKFSLTTYSKKKMLMFGPLSLLPFALCYLIVDTIDEMKHSSRTIYGRIFVVDEYVVYEPFDQILNPKFAFSRSVLSKLTVQRSTCCLKGLKIVQAPFLTILQHHDNVLASHLQLHSVSMPPDTQYPSITFSLTVPQSLSNLGGNLHGGAMSLIFDDITTAALSIVGWQAVQAGGAPDWMEGWQIGGVSRTLNVSYLRPVPVGEKVWVTGEVVGSLGKKLGKPSYFLNNMALTAYLAYCRGTLTLASSGKVAATCEHHKANTKADSPSESRTKAKL